MNKSNGKIVKKLLLYIITFLILGGITYGIIMWNRNKTPDSFERQTPIVSVVKPELRNMSDGITVSGYIESNLMAPVVSFVNGRVVGLNVKAGDSVQKDDIIASISPVNYADIKAPESGVILTVPVKEGDMVQPGTLIAVIGNPSDNCAVVNVPEKYSSFIHISHKAIVTHKDTGNKFLGEVVQIDPYINPKNKTFKVKVNVKNSGNDENNSLMVGSSVSVNIILNEYTDVYAVPITCLNSSDLLYYVHNGVVESASVDNLITDDEYVMINKEMQNADYIIRGQNKVFPGQKVKTEMYKGSLYE